MKTLFVVTKDRLTEDQILDLIQDLDIKAYVYLELVDPKLHEEFCDLNPAYAAVDVHKLTSQIFTIILEQKEKITHTLVQIEPTVDIQCAVLSNLHGLKPLLSVGKIVDNEYRHIQFRDVFDDCIQLVCLFR